MSVTFNFQVPNKLKFFLSSLLAAVILLLGLFWGINAGKQISQAQIILQTEQNTVTALQSFYNDQNRYPSATEFADQNTMLNYLTNFPLPDFSSNICSQSFLYQRISADSFKLSFCLPAADGPYLKGWNSINVSPPAPGGN